MLCRYFEKLCDDSRPRKEVPILETIRTTILTDLNDDCLNEIFGHLNVIELCYVSRVCKRLQELTESYFKRKYSELNFSTLFEAGRLISNQEARVVLCVFGPMITSINIQRQAFPNHEAVGHVEEAVLKDIAEYCSKELITLILTGFAFTSRAVEALNLLSGSLKGLKLDGSVFADCVLHLINFSSLTSLSLANSADCYALMDTFPNLQFFKLSKVYIPSQCLLHHFIARHSKLEELRIGDCRGVSSAAVRFVAKYVKSIRIFFFQSVNPSESPIEIQENFLQLTELKNLENLALSCSNLSIGNLLAKIATNKIALKGLFISQGLNDVQTIDGIVQMKYLERLAFDRMNSLTGENLMRFAKELIRLQILTIYLKDDITTVALKEFLRHTKQLVTLNIFDSNLIVDSGLYNGILDTVKERRNGTKLEINFYMLKVDVPFLVPRRTIQANENWLIIKKRPISDLLNLF